MRVPPGGFPPNQANGIRRGIAILNSRIPSIMKDTEKFLANVTPMGPTGNMKSKVSSWGVRKYVGGGFGFEYGWRKGDFKVFYPLFVLGGTGIHGPYKTRIVPQTSPVMVWYVDGEKWVAQSTKGQEKQTLFEDSIGKIQRNIDREISMAMVTGARTIKGRTARGK